MQVLEFANEKLPGVQTVQAVPEVLPAVGLTVPAIQAAHIPDPAAAKVPDVHFVHTEDPSGAAVPAKQVMQVDIDVLPTERLADPG